MGSTCPDRLCQYWCSRPSFLGDDREQDMVVHPCKLSTRKVETQGLLIQSRQDLGGNPNLNKQASKKQKQTTATSNLQQQSQTRGRVGKMYSLEFFWILGFWIINWFVLCWGSRWGLRSYDLTHPRWVLYLWVTFPVLICFLSDD